MNRIIVRISTIVAIAASAVSLGMLALADVEPAARNVPEGGVAEVPTRQISATEDGPIFREASAKSEWKNARTSLSRQAAPVPFPSPSPPPAPPASPAPETSAPAPVPAAQPTQPPVAENVAAAPAPAPVLAVDFRKHIQPILETKCLECHRAEKDKGGLRLDTLELAAKGGDTGASIVAGKPEESILLERVTLPHDDDEVMPPKDGKLSEDEIAHLKNWIAQGAVWPEDVVVRYRSKEELEAFAKAEVKKPELRSIAVYPDNFSLETRRDFNTFVVTATYNDDTTKDVTHFVEAQIGDANIARLTHNQVSPVADSGETALTIRYGGKELVAPVKVIGGQQERPISFRLDVMPVFMKEGCNTGGCHGSARGQDGFQLSLFGFDPEGDYYRLTREMAGRRINLAIPKESLLIEKSLERVPHSGAKLFEEGSDSFNTLVEWIKDGAVNDPAEIAQPVSIELYPPSLVLEGTGTSQQMTVRAKYSDGTDRDVTKLVVFGTNAANVADVTEGGLVTAGARGEAFVMARFATFTVGSQVIVIPDDLEYEKPKLEEANYIDQLVNAKLHKLRILPSGDAGDVAFMRRVYLDVVGVLPTPEEQDSFLADGSPDKRAKLIDQLLERKEFTEMWVMKWAELLQIRTFNQGGQNVSYKAALLYFNWLQEKLANDVPMNEIVQEILSGSGGTFTNPTTNYYQIENDPKVVTENVAQVFMGMRIQCAQCHNHPFDRWTMDDYYGFASFFSQIGRKRGEDPRETIVYNRRSGETPHELTKKAMPPKFLGGAAPEIKSGEDRRVALAEWLASPENPYFARNLANIIWAHFFGIGIVDPVDDVRISNPASNPELLDELAKRLTDYNYDVKRLVRDITNSKTYQRTTQVNDSNRTDTTNFSHAGIRRIRAEVLLDIVSQVTETPNKFKGLPLGARAVQIADGNVSTYFLDTFGRAKRETVCSCEVKMDPNLSQALHLLNGDAAHDRVIRGGVVAKMIGEGKDDAAIIRELYRKCFNRQPTETELGNLTMSVAEAGAEQRKSALEDVFWALLNAKEFYFNH